MAENVKGETVVKLLERPDIVKAFADQQNPIEVQVVDSLQDSLLTAIDVKKIKNAYKDFGPISGGAELRQCLIHRYNDQPDVFNLKQFIDALENIGSPVHLKELLLADCQSTDFLLFDAPDGNLARIVNKLSAHYEKRFSKYQPSPLAEPFSIADVWVNLSLAKGLLKVQPTNYLEMVKQAYQDDQFSLLIGQPGEGKTMTMKRLAYDWSTGNLKDYDLVFCVPLREMQDESGSILDMALTNMQNNGVLKKADVSYLQSMRDNMVGEPKTSEDTSNQLHILIILDGYDELSSNIQCKELSDILFKRDVSNLDYCVLLTSRPYAVEDIQVAAPKLFIEPLNKEQQTTYMFQHFKDESLNDPTDKMIKVKSLLSQNPSLQQPAKTPLLLCFICILCDVLTATDDAVQLYKLLFNAMVERYESTVSSSRLMMGSLREVFNQPFPNINHAPFSISTEAMRRLFRRSLRGVFNQSFPDICAHELIYNLGRMALTGLVGDSGYAPDKLQFTEDELKNFGIDGDYCTKVGFLNVQLQGKYKPKLYEFPHKTMQEFFSALLIIHEISKCKKIEVNRNPQTSFFSLIFNNRERLFQDHTLLNQVFTTSKDTALEQFFCFLLEMSADLGKNIAELHKLENNTISFFLGWIYRNNAPTIFQSLSIIRTLLKQLPNCSDANKSFLRNNLVPIISYYDDYQSLLLHLSTYNISMYIIDDVCFYIPDIDAFFIMDQSSIDRNILSHASPLSYKQLKEKCGPVLSLCIVDFTAWKIFRQVCKAIDWKKILYMKINITDIPSIINEDNSQLLEQKLQVEAVNFYFERTIESPFDFMPVWNCFISLFTDIKQIQLESLGNDLRVIGLDQIFVQSEIRNSIKIITLLKITFPNEQTVSVAEQLKKCKSIERFEIWNYESISEQYLFMLLDSVKEAGVSELSVTECCLQQRDIFNKFCSRLQEWQNLRTLGFGGMSLSSNLIDKLCETLSQLQQMEYLILGAGNKVNENHIVRLKETNPKLFVIL